MKYGELFRDYCQALQALIAAGANVRLALAGRSCGVIEVRDYGEELLVCYITSESPTEQQMTVSPFTSFSVAFSKC